MYIYMTVYIDQLINICLGKHKVIHLPVRRNTDLDVLFLFTSRIVLRATLSSSVIVAEAIKMLDVNSDIIQNTLSQVCIASAFPR